MAFRTTTRVEASDDELVSKKVSSPEYLTVLRKQNRAIVVASPETRCAERNELAAIRSVDAALSLEPCRS